MHVSHAAWDAACVVLTQLRLTGEQLNSLWFTGACRHEGIRGDSLSVSQALGGSGGPQPQESQVCHLFTLLFTAKKMQMVGKSYFYDSRVGRSLVISVNDSSLSLTLTCWSNIPYQALGSILNWFPIWRLVGAELFMAFVRRAGLSPWHCELKTFIIVLIPTSICVFVSLMTPWFAMVWYLRFYLIVNRGFVSIILPNTDGIITIKK